jgi:nucleoside-diphosphate-sugar epimerase
VTGAGGFIGAALLAPLAEFFGEIRAGQRRSAPPAIASVVAVPADLDDPAQIAAALRGVSLVVHTACGEEQAMLRQAKNLLAAMEAAGAQSLLAFSSIAVYGRRECAVEEDDPPVGPLGAYAEAKAECERCYRAWSAATPGRRVIALRPGIVYGRGSRLWIDKMAARIEGGGWGRFGPRGEGSAALIHIDDLAAQSLAASRLLAGPRREQLPPFVALNAVGPESPSWNEYFAALAGALATPPLRTWSPLETFLRPILSVPAKVARRFGLNAFKKAALAPSPGELALFGLKAEYSGDKATRLLGFSPRIGLAEGLSRSGLDQARR